MASISIASNIHEFKKIARKLQASMPNSHTQHTIMRRVASYILDETTQNFEQEQTPDGTRWQSLSPRTLLARAGKNPYTKKGHLRNSAAARMSGAKILRNKGRLLRSIHSEHSATHAEVGTNLIYAAIHQFGGMAGRGRKVKIPARPYLGLEARHHHRIKTIAEKTLQEHIG